MAFALSRNVGYYSFGKGEPITQSDATDNLAHQHWDTLEDAKKGASQDRPYVEYVRWRTFSTGTDNFINDRNDQTAEELLNNWFKDNNNYGVFRHNCSHASS